VSLEERFWAKVDKSGECWLWTASKVVEGYGQFFAGRRSAAGHPQPTRAHRVAYELLVGPIPEGMTLDHLCRNRACVNPTHLEPVPLIENLRRGEGFAARNAGKTHCPKGHLYDEHNTYAWKPGMRRCRVCNTETARAYRKRKAAAA